MTVFSQRHRGYIAGLVVFAVGVVTFVVGFSTPYWSDYTFRVGTIEIKGHSGLWTNCFKGLYGDSKCSGHESSPDWMIAVKVLQCIALAGMGLSTCYVVATNFMMNTVNFNRVLEALTAMSGGLCIGGAATYAARSSKDVDFVNKMDNSFGFDDFSMSWAFGLAIAGGCLNLCATVLFTIYNRPVAPVPASSGTILSHATAPGSAPVAAPGVAHAYSYQPGSNPYSVAVVQSSMDAPPAYPGLQTQVPAQPVVVYTANSQSKY